MLRNNDLRGSFALALFALFPLFSRDALAQDEVVPVDEEVPVKDATPKTPAPAPAPTAPKPSPAPSPVPAGAPAASGGAAVDEEANTSRPPPRGKAVIWGVLTDSRLGEPIPDAEVSITRKKKKRSVFTDVDGRYRLEVDPGSYDVRFWAEVHIAQVVKGVTVELGTVAQLDADLEADESAVDIVEVETTAEKQAVEGQILMRQRSAAVGDSIGRAEIAKTSDRTAAQTARRVVGATVVGNRFVYVRGLGERYTNALLNGTPLPSPEPDVNAVPLDLFPSLVLDNLTIAKTFTPDVPGDFAGGSVRIETREIPKKFFFSPTIALGYNTESTFRNRLTYPGSGTDWLGFDSGLRSLPGSIPAYKLTENGPKPGGGTITAAELKKPGEAINSYMTAKHAGTGPNFAANVVLGDGFDLGKGQRLGYLAALTYGQTYTVRHEIYREYRSNGPDLARNVDYNIETGNTAVRWGAFGSVTYEPARGHQVKLIGLHSQLSDNTARWADGNITAPGTVTRHQTRLSFVSRALSFGQLSGEHELKPLNRATLDWNLSLAHAGRNEPDSRDDVWEFEPEASSHNYRYAGSNAQAGRHLYAEQGENAYGGGLNFTQPIDAARESKLKAGGLFSIRNREFAARRFNYEYARGADPVSPPLQCNSPQYDEACADTLFQNQNIGPSIQLDESTLATDAYHAKLNVFAGYLMGDISLTKDLRAIVGERVEVTHQTIDPYDQFNSGAKLSGANLKSTDLLPAAGLVFATSSKSKLRASITRTLARPQLRELAPYLYNEIVGGTTISGNPNLKITDITNGDIRFEYFPTLREVLAMSVFAKHFVNPIETVILQTGGANTLTFENSPSANLIGLELEARKGLDFIHKALQPFSAIANLTLAWSRIEVRQTGADFITNTSRALTNQAPYVVNFAIDYAGEHGLNARLMYNVVGPRIVAVGTGGLDDSYEQPRHLLDASVAKDFGKHFNVKFTAENLLNSPFLVTLGSESKDENIVRKYKEGLTFVLSGQYTY